LSQSRVPLEILGTVDAAPVPVSIHDTADEVLVIDMRGRVVNGVASSDGFARGCDCSAGEYEGDDGEKLHDGNRQPQV
jgi:hypothetical protein